MNPQTITRLRASAVDDRYGDGSTQLDWRGVLDELELPPGVWAPMMNKSVGGGGANSSDGREGRVNGWKFVWVNSETIDVTAIDRIRWNDQLYLVDGEPAIHEHPRTKRITTEIHLVKAVG